MKRVLTWGLLALLLAASLPSCGCGGEVIDYGLVFVNDSDATIVEVVVDSTDQFGGARRADSRPLKRGESLGFEAGEYPVTVAVYDQLFKEGLGQKELASITIKEAPAEGERWYVTARDSGRGLALSVSEQWPEGV